jgi:hypothetical protein
VQRVCRRREIAVGKACGVHGNGPYLCSQNINMEQVFAEKWRHVGGSIFSKRSFLMSARLHIDSSIPNPLPLLHSLTGAGHCWRMIAHATMVDVLLNAPRSALLSPILCSSK